MTKKFLLGLTIEQRWISILSVLYVFLLLSLFWLVTVWRLILSHLQAAFGAPPLPVAVEGLRVGAEGLAVDGDPRRGGGGDPRRGGGGWRGRGAGERPHASGVRSGLVRDPRRREKRKARCRSGWDSLKKKREWEGSHRSGNKRWVLLPSLYLPIMSPKRAIAPFISK